jgi:hypothetical protein
MTNWLFTVRLLQWEEVSQLGLAAENLRAEQSSRTFDVDADFRLKACQ